MRLLVRPRRGRPLCYDVPAMSKDDDFDLLETTINTGIEVSRDPKAELDAVLDDLEALLKDGDVMGWLTGRGINVSLALVGAQGLRSYLAGDKQAAAEDFSTVSDEIHARMAGPSQGDAE